MPLVVTGTRTEIHELRGHPVCVKRDDLCSPAPGPSFAKVRGLELHLRGRIEPVIGAMDTLHSKAGWGVAWVCRALKKKAVVYYPKYKGEAGLRENQRRCRDLGAELVPFEAGMSAVLYNRAKTDLNRRYGRASYMLPNALKLQESVNGTAAEVATVPAEMMHDATWLVSISSGTLAAGVIRGLKKAGGTANVVLHMGYSRPKASVWKYLEKKVGTRPKFGIEIVDEGYAYRDRVDTECPFPCNPYYDLKAWKWLAREIENRETRWLFWNIGA